MKLAWAALMIFALLPRALYGDEDDVENFILPETPPTIERVKKPPLDQPFLQKQDFVPEFDLSPAPVLVGLKFYRFTSEQTPVEINAYQGSFNSRGGGFVYASTNSVNASYFLDDTDGEYANLEHEKNTFNINYAKDLSSNRFIFAGLHSEDKIIWLEHKDSYGFDCGYSWYFGRDLNLKAGANYSKGEVKGQDTNESVSGSLSALCQPFEGQSAAIEVCPQKDTALGAKSEFDFASFRYDVMLFSRAVLGGGARYTFDKVFPQGYFTLSLAPGMKLSVNYLPGIEKVSWDKLYISDSYTGVNTAVSYPESVYSFTENISYYLNESNSVEFEIAQANWKNYLFWEQVPGQNFISPRNVQNIYAASARMKAVFRKGRFALELGAEENSDNGIPYVPGYDFSAGIGCTLGTWSFNAGCIYNGPVYYALGNTAKLDAYNNVSLTVKKELTKDIELYASCDNILSDKIETQLGFIKNAPVFYAGLKLKL